MSLGSTAARPIVIEPRVVPVHRGVGLVGAAARRVELGGRGRDTTPAPKLDGDELLAAVTESISALHERYHGRRPVTAKSQLMGDDLLACVMGGVYTEVQRLSGRRVVGFVSDSHVGLDLELFFLAPALPGRTARR